MQKKVPLRLLAEQDKIRELSQAVKNNKCSNVYGLTGTNKVLLASLFLSNEQESTLIICENPQRAKEMWEGTILNCPEEEVLYFPAYEDIPFEVLAKSREIQNQRIKVLLKLVAGEKITVVCSADSLAKKLLSPEFISSGLLLLETGQRISRSQLLSYFQEHSYERSEQVGDIGQFSLRGGICDFYPPLTEQPVRLEFFDDEIETIRFFNPETQLSERNIEQILLCPAQEFFLSAQALERGLRSLEAEFAEQKRRLAEKKKREDSERLQRLFKEIKEKILTGTFLDKLEHYQGYFYPEHCTLLDFFSEDNLVILEEPSRIFSTLGFRDKERDLSFSRLLGAGFVLPGQREYFARKEEMELSLSAKRILELALLPTEKNDKDRKNYSLTGKSIPSFLGKLSLVANEIERWKKEDYLVVLFASTKSKGERIRRELEDAECELSPAEKDFTPRAGRAYIIEESISGGAEFSDLKLVFLSERELSSHSNKKPRKRMFRENGERITRLTDIHIGDYIVHAAHGIGRYLGVEKLETGGIAKDYLIIKYSGEDRLYVPVDQVDSLQKYNVGEGTEPKINKLGGGEWNKTKQKVTAAVRELAENLIELYARRSMAKGYAYSSDDNWQREFEDSFIFEETPDQLKSISEVKKDMEKSSPMDRLLCGDVGYGKTEVALRAAFKAANDGKQVAILVPTTILAEQHYRTFSERMEGFPIRIAVLSRFKSNKEQKEIIEALNQGKVDIVIGTHRLLNKSISFKDLGLLIIDEEQRFGVRHKEKLKNLREHIDVLTLTATPIPRTLHMSLIGLRDISVIETPPENRYPIQTYVVEYSPNMIREAIGRELGRGGQVFFVHNRVQDIEQIGEELRELFPEARIIIAHGQMRENELEKAMLAFLKKEGDILLCTTIIETGLDISNVNTMIINDADRMGLAQLYQLRGRVGRTDRIAYAYLTYRKNKILTEQAEKRLYAIREFTELGSGFKIAMRDLEIRGAGNVLGAEQHGHVSAVGFDMYYRLLEEAVKEIKGETGKVSYNLEVDLEISAYLPDTFIADQGLKLDFYQRLQRITDEKELEELEAELRDRFGDLPEEALNLLDLIRLKTIGYSLKIKAIRQKNNKVELIFAEDPGFQGEELLSLAKSCRGKLSFGGDSGFLIKLDATGFEQSSLLLLLENLLRECQKLGKRKGNAV